MNVAISTRSVGSETGKKQLSLKGSSQKKKIADLRTYAELWGGGVQPNPN